jgi:hypothetical protein
LLTGALIIIILSGGCDRWVSIHAAEDYMATLPDAGRSLHFPTRLKAPSRVGRKGRGEVMKAPRDCCSPSF